MSYGPPLHRSASDRGVHPYPLPKSARATLPIRSTQTPTVYPYSSISREMEVLLDDHSAQLKSAKSYNTLTFEKYTKLDGEQPHSQSLHDLSLGPPPHDHQESMAIIREDINRFSRKDGDIPKASSKWSKFMCESESEEEKEEGEGNGENSIHMLSSRSLVAKYRFEETT